MSGVLLYFIRPCMLSARGEEVTLILHSLDFSKCNRTYRWSTLHKYFEKNKCSMIICNLFIYTQIQRWKAPSLFNDAVITVVRSSDVQKRSDFLKPLLFPAVLVDRLKVVQAEVEMLQNFVHFFFRIVTHFFASTINPRHSCKQNTLKLNN